MQGRSGPTVGVDRKEELREKVAELGALCPVDAAVGTINFEIFDIAEGGEVGELGQRTSVQCIRVVEVSNPNKRDGASEVKTISLLPPFRRNAANLGVLESKILPQSMGGI